MPSKKNSGGDKNAGSEDAARAARRAARDKAFGRSGATPSSDGQQEETRSDDPLGSLFTKYRGDGSESQETSREGPRERENKVSQQRRAIPHRELPMSGSASELRRLRKGGDLPLERINCDAIAADINKRKRLLYGAMILVGIAVLAYIVGAVMQLKQVMYVTRFSLIAAPICLGFAVNDLCMRLARNNPRLACRILSMLTFGNANSLRNLAHLYMDQGDFAKAEKTLSSSIGAIDPKRKLRDYILMHALFANLRAHIGRATEAEKMIREVLNAAEAHEEERKTNGSAFLLANTLNYAAQLCDVTDKMHDALALARRAVKLLCDHDMPPADVALVALYNAGYYCNVHGEYQEAIRYLTKAQELATKTGIARDGEMAFILSNLGIANLGIGRATQCKRLLGEAETKALAPLGMAERPHTYQCWAIYHFANDRLEYSLQSYEKAIEFCSQQIPKESVFLLRIIREYSVLLREIGKTREANANEQRVTQIRETLHTLSAYVPTKKDKKIQIKVPVTKSRFPLFSIVVAGFFGFSVWEEGLRFAPLTRWLFFLTSLVVVAVKIRAKYFPPAKEETSQGAIIAIVSVIPGLRSIVPELTLVPQKTAGIIIGGAVLVFILVQATVPSLDMVPDSGLFGQEYLVLGDSLVEKESLNKARKAYELASKNGAGPIADMKLKRDIPKENQPEEAIEENMKALEMSHEKGPNSSKKARIMWEQCVAKYPNFEYPYVHLAALVNPNELTTGLADAIQAAKAKRAKDKKETVADEPTTNVVTSRSEKRAKAHEAEALLKKALDINPNFGLALLEMCSVKINLSDKAGCTKYAKKFLEITGDSDPVGKLTGERMLALARSGDKAEVEKSDSGKIEPAQSDENNADEPKSDTSKVSSDDETTPAEEAPLRKVKVKSVKELKEIDERLEQAVNSKKSTTKPAANNLDDSDWGDDPKSADAVKKVPSAQKSAGTAKKDSETKTKAAPALSAPVKPAAPAKSAPVISKSSSDAPAKPKAATPKPEKRKKKTVDDSWKKLSPDDTDW